MRKQILLITAIILLCGCSHKPKQEMPNSDDPLTGNIQLSGAFALYPMAVRCAEEFKKLHPNVRIDISGGGAGKGMTDALAGVVDIGMVSREIYPEETAKGAYPFAVVKDAVVPVVNTKNPQIDNIRKTGLTKETANKLWNKELKIWGEILNTSATTPVHVFTRSDACGAAETFAAWLGKKQENLSAIAVFGDPGIASAIQKDRVSIGYNNIAYVYDQRSKKPFDGLTVIPIDVNENGQIDPEEDFYDNIDTFIQAVNEGRYPSPPARDLYLVTKGKPSKPELIAFLEYMLSDGQQFAEETGYIRLSDEKLSDEKEKLK